MIVDLPERLGEPAAGALADAELPLHLHRGRHPFQLPESRLQTLQRTFRQTRGEFQNLRLRGRGLSSLPGVACCRSPSSSEANLRSPQCPQICNVITGSEGTPGFEPVPWLFPPCESPGASPFITQLPELVVSTRKPYLRQSRGLPRLTELAEPVVCAFRGAWPTVRIFSKARVSPRRAAPLSPRSGPNNRAPRATPPRSPPSELWPSWENSFIAPPRWFPSVIPVASAGSLRRKCGVRSYRLS